MALPLLNHVHICLYFAFDSREIVSVRQKPDYVQLDPFVSPVAHPNVREILESRHGVVVAFHVCADVRVNGQCFQVSRILYGRAKVSKCSFMDKCEIDLTLSETFRMK